MKILILQDRLRSGGTERQSVLLANSFAAAGHATTLLTFRPGGALAPTVDAAVDRRSLQPFDLGLDWFAPRLLRTIGDATPAIVLCMGRMANCYAGRIQRRFPAFAVVATMRTGKPLPRPFRRSLARVRHIIANSHEARDRLIALHAVPGEKISVIHNSLVFAAGSTALRNDALRAAHGAGPATTVLLCVAMFRPEKNQRELLEIVAGLPAGADWQLWLAGEGPARAACAQLAAGKNLSARVKFLGFQRDPSALYATADIAVHASWSEALSNFLIEAQSHGLPVVAYEAQGIRECIIPGDTGWSLPRDDRAAFRATLTALMTEPAADRADRAARARAFARAAFDPQTQVAAYLDLFHQLSPAPSP
jgi:glycosyltransferase involved in cell wall biosynthesis